MSRDAIQLPKQFIDKFPDMKQEKMDKLHHKYLNTIRRFLFKALPHIQGDVINFPLAEAQNMCGDFQYKNVRYYVWQEFMEMQPFFYVIKTGTNFHNMISEVRLYDQKYVDLLIDTADTTQLVDTFYSKYDIGNKINIPIDHDSLSNYINRTEFELKNTMPGVKYDKMLQNLRTAKFFKIISEHFYTTYGEYVIPHIESDKKHYGRTYYKGINLQNCTKEVRNAALGDHVSYDLNAAVYAVKLILAENIFNEYGTDFYGNFTYTKEYLDHKSKIRQELADVIYQHMPNHPQPIKLVKEAITAIGFGAKMHEGSWEYEGITRYNALHYIIYNQKARKAFVQHPFIINFLKEQDLLIKIIYEYYSRDTDFYNKVKDIPDMMNNNGKLRKSKVMAYLYQHMETKIMDTITENIVPRLRIHDSFIMSKLLDNHTLLDIKHMLNNMSPYLSLTMEEQNGWLSQEIYDRELQHKEFIKREELKANNGVMPVKYTKTVEYQYNHTDSRCYDGYDDGSRYEEYDMQLDTSVNDMTLEEKRHHYRIIGYEVNQLPENINKLIGNK